MISCLSLVTLCETETAKAIEACARAGFSHVEFWWPRLKTDLQAGALDQILEALEEHKVKPAGVAGLGLELAGSDALWRESLARAIDALLAMSALKIPMVTFTPGICHDPPHEALYSTAIERLGDLAEIARGQDLELALEIRSDSRWLTSIDTAAAIISQVDNPRVGLCLDLFHYYLGPSKQEDLNAIVVGLLKSVQFSDLIGTPRELARDSDRILPGEGDFELSAIVARLQKYNYDGLVTVEVPNPHLWPIASDRVADMANQSISRIWPELVNQELELPDQEPNTDHA